MLDKMDTISHKSAELKTLADGFEVVKNNRLDKRTVLTPPAVAKNNTGNKVYIFDMSSSGLSFYFDQKQNQLQQHNRVTLHLEQAVTGKTLLKVEIVYVSTNIMNGVYFYGAKIIA